MKKTLIEAGRGHFVSIAIANPDNNICGHLLIEKSTFLEVDGCKYRLYQNRMNMKSGSHSAIRISLNKDNDINFGHISSGTYWSSNLFTEYNVINEFTAEEFIEKFCDLQININFDEYINLLLS